MNHALMQVKCFKNNLKEKDINTHTSELNMKFDALKDNFIFDTHDTNLFFHLIFLDGNDER